MSFQPPQPPGQPPQQPPAWGGPPGSGGLELPPVPVKPASGRAHKPRMVAPAMIVAAVVLIAVAVGVVMVSGGGGGGVDGQGAADGFATLGDDAEYDDSGYFELRRCPLGDQDDLNERVAEVLDLSDEVVDGDTLQYMSDRYEDFPESLWCVSSDGEVPDGGSTDDIVYTASELPGDDYDRFLEDSFPDGEVEVGEPQGHKGGTIYPYCFEPAADSGGAPGCGADWVNEDDEITIGLNYTTDDGESGSAVDALKELLPDMVKALAEQA